jgi:hypothetical protein
MSLNHFTDTVEKKWLKIGCEEIAIYGAESVADGSAAAPSITFNSDTDTGLYRIGDNNIGVSCGGVKTLDVKQGELRINNAALDPAVPLFVSLTAAQGQDSGSVIAGFFGTGERLVIKDQNTAIANTPPAVEFNAGLGGDIKLNGKKGLQLFDNGAGALTSVVCGTQSVLPNNSTSGFVYVPSLIGAPTGVPVNFAGSVPLCVDGPGQRLYVYCNGAWRSVALV